MAGLTRTPLRKCRLRLVVFDVKMWRFIDWLRVTLPVPVSLNRFLAPLCDFSFGTILPSPDARSENKHPLPHPATLNPGKRLPSSRPPGAANHSLSHTASVENRRIAGHSRKFQSAVGWRMFWEECSQYSNSAPEGTKRGQEAVSRTIRERLWRPPFPVPGFGCTDP